MARTKVAEGFLMPLAAGTAAGVIANQFPQNQRSTKRVLAEKEKKGRIKKVAPTFSKSAGFNEKAAQEAFDLVMKMDTETARFFTSAVVSEVVEETIEKNLRTLQGHLNKVVAKREEQIKKALVRIAISKAEDTLPYAEALTEITKAKTPYDYGYRFQESDFNRDPSTGQFRMKVKHTMSKPVSDRQAPSIIGTTNPTKLKGEDLARYQDEYRQVAGFLDAVDASIGRGNANTILHLRDRTTGERWAEPVYSLKTSKDILEDPNIEIQGAEARPTTLHAGGAAFGLATALGRGEFSPNTSRAMSGAASGFGDFTQGWMSSEDGDVYNRNAKTYRRLESGSKYLGQVAPAGSKLQMAAAFGQFAGEMGPQAEMVIGPTARKTAYRYRGTEKTPDAEMTRNYETAIKRAKQYAVAEQFAGPRRRTQGTGTHVHQRAAEIAAERRPPTWEERDAGRGVIINHLRDKLPSEQLSELQLASGNTPPSEGIMLNKDGQIVSQAVGYADDHYLPFDLKNLKNLKGGEYIRTRSYGGLTSEDIYTGLISGARQVTVVSHNGVFTMEFEPDFRGGRRYNDKARRMTRRYEQILDAVQSGQVDRAGIDPLVRAKIVEGVRADFPNESPATIQNAITTRMEQYKSSPELQPEDEEVILELARARAASDPSRDARDYVAQVTNDLMQKKALRFQLDGPGYEAAQNALREQFPYYIKTRAEVRGPRDTINPTVDRGYVEPGRNRPTAARAGLFGTSVNQGKKFSASQADYQGAKAVRRGGTPDGEERLEKPEEGEGKKPLPKDVARDIIAERKYRDAAEEIHQVFNDPGVLDPASRTGVLGVLNQPVDQFTDPLRANELSAAVNELERHRAQFQAAGQTAALRALEKYKLAVNVPEGYTPELGLHWTPAPVPFPGKAYQPGASLEDRQAEVRKINGRTQSVLYGGNLSSLSEDQMRQEVKALADVYRIVKDHPELQSRDQAGAEQRKRVASELFGGYDRNAVDMLLEKPNKLANRIEDLHRMRALMTPFWQQGMNVENFTARVPEAPKEVHVERPAISPRTPEQQTWHQAMKKQVINDHMDRLRLGMRQASPGQTAEHEAAINAGHALLGDLDAVGDDEIVQWRDDTNHLTHTEERRPGAH